MKAKELLKLLKEETDIELQIDGDHVCYTTAGDAMNEKLNMYNDLLNSNINELSIKNDPWGSYIKISVI